MKMRRKKSFTLMGLPIIPIVLGYLAGMLTGDKVKAKIPFLDKFSL